jgi:hypothetical protein
MIKGFVRHKPKDLVIFGLLPDFWLNPPMDDPAPLPPNFEVWLQTKTPKRKEH